MSTEIDLTIEAYDVIDNDRIEGFNVTVTPQVPGGNGPTFSGLTNSAGKATFQNVHVSYNFYFQNLKRSLQVNVYFSYFRSPEILFIKL